jgi:hypothetical protein
MNHYPHQLTDVSLSFEYPVEPGFTKERIWWVWVGDHYGTYIVNPATPRNRNDGENSQMKAWPVDRSARQGTWTHAVVDAEVDGRN